MEGELTVPAPKFPSKPMPLLVPVANSLKGQAELIAKNAGLSLVKPRFFVVDTTKMAQEEDIQNPQHPYGPEATSIFGLPVFDIIKFDQVTYTDFDGVEVKLGGLTLEIVLFEIDLPRNIVRTKVSGRNGTVKEYISDDDYQIKISGSLVNPMPNLPPVDAIRALNSYCKSQIEVPVNSNVLSYLDIYSIVVTNAKFVQKQGYRNVFDFVLECVSETPFEIQTEFDKITTI